MHLLYLDDSGSVGNADDRHIVLAGLAVFERQPHWFSARLEEIAARLWPENPRGLEFRGADIYAGRKHWRGIGKDARLGAYRDALGIIGHSTQVRVFGAAVHKASVSPDEPMELAFEYLCNRFDRFLGRLHRRGDTQRGLIILDESSYETSLQGLAHNFRTEGHRWGQLYNLSEVPLFVNSKATRMIQFADMIAYALRRYYEKGDPSLFDILAPRLDAEGGVLHGLVHHVAPEHSCNCHACRQARRI
jgi:Protein of unknown function (DUF3800)